MFHPVLKIFKNGRGLFGVTYGRAPGLSSSDYVSSVFEDFQKRGGKLFRYGNLSPQQQGVDTAPAERSSEKD
jgi:hypothetical protein